MPPVENGVEKPDAGTAMSMDLANNPRKRKVIVEEKDESDEEDMSVAPPVHDIYRQRQQKRVR